MTTALLMLFLAATPEPPQTWHALIIGNNTSPTQGRPTLAYADDDAIRYAFTLSPVVPDANRLLLARPDPDSKRLSELGVIPTGPPTVAAVRDAFESLRQSFERLPGKAGLFVFFAGHGDVERGEGFLELEDGRLTGSMLEAWLSTLKASEVHVVLDSCNSYFVLSPRKPGGRRFATPADLAQALGRKLPQVGVFLSTGAEAESWEWSELESGVFSYLLRSGLAGPADLDANGVITYGELRRFVGIAGADVSNARLRPRVFARGPRGADDAPFLTLASRETVGFRSLSPAATHVVVTDIDGTRWLEANVEPNQPMLLQVPTTLASRLRVREQGSVSRRLFDPTSTVELRQLAVDPMDKVIVRGGGPSLTALFSTSFGPAAVEAFDKRQPVETSFGVTEAEFERLLGVLERLAALESSDRTRSLLLAGTTGATFVTLGSVGLASQRSACATWCELRSDGLVFIAAGVATTALSAVDIAVSNRVVDGAERLLRDVRSARTTDPVQFGERVERVFLVALEERRKALRIQRWGWTAALAANVAFAVAEPLTDLAGGRPFNFRNTAFSIIGLGLLASNLIVDLFRDDERERLMQLWVDGRAPQTPRLSVSGAVVPGGAAMALGVSF